MFIISYKCLHSGLYLYPIRRFNHFATNCQDKDKIQIYDRCTDKHDIKNSTQNNS